MNCYCEAVARGIVLYSTAIQATHFGVRKGLYDQGRNVPASAASTVPILSSEFVPFVASVQLNSQSDALSGVVVPGRPCPWTI